MTIRPIARRVRGLLRRTHGQLAMRTGRAASTAPLSIYFGYDRGTPIDRFYIEQFLRQNASDIRGSVLEVGDSAYSARFGGDSVNDQHVLDIDIGNQAATIVGDLCTPGLLPAARFDCIILTQTLHVLFDMRVAIAELRQSLKPGGVLLLTVPGISPVRPGSGYDWYWSLTEQALAKLLSAAFEEANIETASNGSLFAATAFLHGAALEEIPIGKLKPMDPAYPVVVTGRAVA